MGTQEVQANLNSDERRAFMKSLLNDVRSLERMLEGGQIEDGVRRIGAEQELVLIDEHWQPSPVAMEVLEHIDDPRVTTEIARFNLEFNLDPQLFTGNCLSVLHRDLSSVLELVRHEAHRQHSEVLLTGILPTLTRAHLGMENISDRPRYFALNDALTRMRGGAYELSIKGTDELDVEHDSIMLESLNTSFQLHYQTGPDEFAPLYNVAQAVVAPVMAAACNSPILFGKRLWRETRIAIFQQTVDTRLDVPQDREMLPRVRFGEGWVNDSVLELFQADVARFRVILGMLMDEESTDVLDRGELPALKALQLHNSTVYRWNRACYGAADGTAHLRIENRVLPAGPTLLDETANAAFWFGLMAGGREAFGDVRQKMDFDDARSNFITAARQGLAAEITWLGGRSIPTAELILGELLDVARHGLREAEIDGADIDRYLGVIEERVRSRRTGAQWLLDSAAQMRHIGTRSERLTALTAAIFSRQRADAPAHTWPLATLTEAGNWKRNHMRVEQYMTTDLFTVPEDELIDLVATLMDWEHIRHVPVEDERHRLVGLVSYRALLRLLARGDGREMRVPVKDIMECKPVTVSPSTTTVEAIAIMRDKKVACLPVVDNDGRLVGIVTDHDFMNIAATVLEEQLAD